MIMDKILMAGGSGMIGKALAAYLMQQGYEINYLVRNKESANGTNRFFWDYKTGYVDAASLEGVGYIINLCGANVGTHMWTKKYKQEIIDSRVLSGRTLAEIAKAHKAQIKKYISAGGISYYGDCGTKLMAEDEPLGKGFLAEVSAKWENEVLPLEDSGIPTVIFRMGVVFSKAGGFVPIMALPTKFFAAASLGSGLQFMSWIHVDDVVSAYYKAIADPDFKGIYNLVAPTPATINEITKQIAQQLNRPVLLPNVPAVLLKLLFGQRSEIFLDSVNASPKKLIAAGFTFRYPTLQSALKQVFSK